ncbi:hypothetical protein GGI35DRAFT_462403 [Trichoderma velutinum]
MRSLVLQVLQLKICLVFFGESAQPIPPTLRTQPRRRFADCSTCSLSAHFACKWVPTFRVMRLFHDSSILSAVMYFVWHSVGGNRLDVCCLNKVYQVKDIRGTQDSILKTILVGKQVEAYHFPINDSSQLVQCSHSASRRYFPDEDVARLEIVVTEEHMTMEIIQFRRGKFNPAYVSMIRLQHNNVIKVQQLAPWWFSCLKDSVEKLLDVLI